MRLTSRGLAVLIGVVAFGAAGWVLGVSELLVLSIACSALMVATGTWVRTRPIDADVRRSIRPPRIEAGSTCNIELRVTNTTRRRGPSIELSDRVEQLGSLRAQLAGLEPGEGGEAVFAFTTVRRGLYPAGPIQITVTDPFNLWRRRRRIDHPASVLVLPRTWPIGSLLAAAGDEFERVQRVPDVGSSVDDEFNSLREYVAGDDLRMVHWPTTARTGTPMVRQFDKPWQRRTTVVVDVTAHESDADSLDRAVSVAASVVAAAARGDELIRLATSDGSDTDFVAARTQEPLLLDHLAVAGRRPARHDTHTHSTHETGAQRLDTFEHRTDDEACNSLSSIIRSVSTGGGAVIVATPRSDSRILSELVRSAGWPLRAAVVVCTAARPVGLDATTPVLCWDGTVDLDTAWAKVGP